MAVMLHFCVKDQHRRLVIRSRLGAFRHVRGSHDGPTLASHFIEVLDELGLLHKVCYLVDLHHVRLLVADCDPIAGWYDHSG